MTRVCPWESDACQPTHAGQCHPSHVSRAQYSPGPRHPAAFIWPSSGHQFSDQLNKWIDIRYRYLLHKHKMADCEVWGDICSIGIAAVSYSQKCGSYLVMMAAHNQNQHSSTLLWSNLNCGLLSMENIAILFNYTISLSYTHTKTTNCIENNVPGGDSSCHQLMWELWDDNLQVVPSPQGRIFHSCRGEYLITILYASVNIVWILPRVSAAGLVTCPIHPSLQLSHYHRNFKKIVYQCQWGAENGT